MHAAAPPAAKPLAPRWHRRPAAVAAAAAATCGAQLVRLVVSYCLAAALVVATGRPSVRFCVCGGRVLRAWGVFAAVMRLVQGVGLRACAHVALFRCAWGVWRFDCEALCHATQSAPQRSRLCLAQACGLVMTLLVRAMISSTVCAPLCVPFLPVTGCVPPGLSGLAVPLGQRLNDMSALPILLPLCGGLAPAFACWGHRARRHTVCVLASKPLSPLPVFLLGKAWVAKLRPTYYVAPNCYARALLCTCEAIHSSLQAYDRSVNKHVEQAGSLE